MQRHQVEHMLAIRVFQIDPSNSINPANLMTKSAFLLILISLSALLLFDCTKPQSEDRSNDTSDTLQPATGTTAAAVASEPEFQVSDSFQKQLGEVLTSYLTLKEAFVASDSNSVPGKAMAIRESLSKVEVSLLSGDALQAGTKYLPALENSLKDIQSTNNMGKQRRAFGILSDSLYATIKAFGVGGKEAYYEFCPMAFNEEGAYWISDTEKIRNPYFGDKMLTCGEVKERLK
jgi:Cu(I)/Ag(I) efflux system membrane fusion protein